MLELGGAVGDNHKLVVDLEVSASNQLAKSSSLGLAHPEEADSEELASRSKFPWETLQAA